MQLPELAQHSVFGVADVSRNFLAHKQLSGESRFHDFRDSRRIWTFSSDNRPSVRKFRGLVAVEETLDDLAQNLRKFTMTGQEVPFLTMSSRENCKLNLNK